MKRGDKIPVNISNDVVAQAEVVEIDETNRTVTLIVPATRVVMGLRVELDTTPPEPTGEGAAVVVTGVDRLDGEGNVVSTDNGAVETPQPEATQTSVAPSQQGEQPEQAAPVVETPVQTDVTTPEGVNVAE